MLATTTDPMRGSCARAAGFRKPIPDGFYEDADLRAALARYDFGAVFAAVRQHWPRRLRSRRAQSC